MKIKERLQQKLLKGGGAISEDPANVMNVHVLSEQCNSATAAGLYDEGIEYGLQSLNLAIESGYSRRELATI